MGFSSSLSGCLVGCRGEHLPCCHARCEPCPFSGTAGTGQGWQRRLRLAPRAARGLNIPEKQRSVGCTQLLFRQDRQARPGCALGRVNMEKWDFFLAAVEVDLAGWPPTCWRGGPSWTPVLGGPALPQVLLSLLEAHIHPCGGHPWPTSLPSARWRQTLDRGIPPVVLPCLGMGHGQQPGARGVLGRDECQGCVGTSKPCFGDLKALFWGRTLPTLRPSAGARPASAAGSAPG